jgi:hypothetical protein
MEPGFVKIINPADQSVAEVPESSLPHHHRAGWALLNESPEPEPAADPGPVRAGKKAAAADAGSGTREGE